MLKNFFGPERSANDIQDHPNLLDWPPPPILVCSPIGIHIAKKYQTNAFKDIL